MAKEGLSRAAEFELTESTGRKYNYKLITNPLQIGNGFVIFRIRNSPFGAGLCWLARNNLFKTPLPQP